MASAAPTNEVAPIWRGERADLQRDGHAERDRDEHRGQQRVLTRNQDRSTNSLNWNLRRTRSDPSPYIDAANIEYNPPIASRLRRSVAGSAPAKRSLAVVRLRYSGDSHCGPTGGGATGGATAEPNVSLRKSVSASGRG